MNAPLRLTVRTPALPEAPRLGLSPAEALGSALRALAANKLRAALTALGIFIGVAAVIATVAVGAGARAQVLAQIQSLGANLLVMWSGSVNVGGVRLGAGQRQNLTWEDAKAIAAEIDLVEISSANINQTQQIVGNGANWSTFVHGTDPEFFAARDWPAERGRLFTEEEMNAGAKVAVLGATAAEQLFGEDDPLGAEIRVRQTPMRVIGVLSRKGQSMSGQDQDDVVMIPFWTARRSVMGASRANARTVGWVVIRVHEGEDMRAAEDEVRALMRQRHRVAANEPDDVQVRNMADIAATRDASSRTLSLLLSTIAAVSLLVGGIGIMNIMLVSVAERTREIGLRLAIGARRRDILAQFLIEAVVLALLGGLAGVVAGVIIAHAIASGAGWPVLIQADAIVLALGVSGLTGIVFGYLPARRASRLDPITALRHE